MGLVKELFHKIAVIISNTSGSPFTFIIALIAIVIWAVNGPIFQFSDTWQLIINTSTTIVTFLMVFLIQNTQNRDAKATHLKLDELLRSIKGARNSFLNLEEVSDEELADIAQEFKILHDKYMDEMSRRKKTSKIP